MSEKTEVSFMVKVLIHNVKNFLQLKISLMKYIYVFSRIYKIGVFFPIIYAFDYKGNNEYAKQVR